MLPLDPSYLEYPKRRHGMDHDLYPWSNMFDRPAIDWGNGKTVATWMVVSLEWFPILAVDKPFRAPGHMQTAYPDYRNYTGRDYGTRVGLYRMLDLFDRIGAKVTVAANAAIAERHPSIIRDIVAAGHEIIAHSTDMNGTIATGLAEDEERSLIARSLDGLEKVAGTRPQGWLSIARSQSWATPALLAEAGVRYMCDWVNDELPYRMTTPSGSIVNLPLNHELSDRQILGTQSQSVDEYAEQMLDAHDWLGKEAETYGGRVLAMHLTPYIIGLPYRAQSFERLLETLAARPNTWFARGSEIVEASGI